MDLIVLADRTVDLRQRKILVGDSTVPLTDLETSLLVYLAARPGEVVSRGALLVDVWGYDPQVVSRAVDAAVRRLRSKIEADPTDPAHLLTVHGEGFRFCPPTAPSDSEATVVVVEIAGLDALHRGHPDLAEPAIALAQRIVDDAVRRIGGTGSATGPTGATLPTPRHAARLGLAVQRGLMAADWPDALLAADRHPGETSLWRGLTAKIGACTGPEERARSRARRLAAAAHGGQVLLGIDLAEAAGSIDDLGALRVPLPGRAVGLDPHEGSVVHLVPLELAGRRFPSRTGAALPPPPDLFVGRSDDLEAVHALLEAHPLVTLTGTGGIGKTRLARQIAWTLHADRSVWFCDLSSARTLDDLVQFVARTLDLPFGGQDPPSAARLVGLALAGRGPAVVVLDNLEQLLPLVAETLGSWMAQAPQTTFLATSRRPLSLPAEHIHPLGPLPLPDAVALFWDRAPVLVPPGDDQAAVEAIVAKVDRIPLGIELAAARLGVLSATSLLDRLSASVRARFSLLSRPDATSARHATLWGVLDWSWRLLGERERLALAQCSVFRGGFDLDAAEGVLDLEAHPDDDPMAVADALHGLRRHSLVQAQRSADGRLLLSLYESVRDYAGEQLFEATRGDIRRRHGAYYARFGTYDAIATLSASGGIDRLQRRIRDRANLWAAAQRALDDGDLARGVPILLVLAEVVLLTGPYSAILGPIERALALPDLTPDQRCRLRCSQGHLFLVTGDPRAPIALDDALALSRIAADRRLEGVVHGHLGHQSHRQGRQDQAVEHYRIARRIARANDDPLMEARSVACIANIDANQGRRDAAMERYDQALAMFANLGDRRGEATILVNLGVFHVYGGDLARAEVAYTEALEIFEQIGDRRIIAIILGNLSSVYTGQGRLDKAQGHLERARVHHRDMGDPLKESDVLMYLADIAADRGDLDEAHALLTTAWDQAQNGGSAQSRATIRTSLGEVTVGRGDDVAGREHLEAGLSLARAGSARRQECRALCSLGRLSIRLDDLDGAATFLDQAEAIARDMEDAIEQGLLTCQRGHLAHAAGRPDDALAYLVEVRAQTADLSLGPTSPLRRAIDGLDREITSL